MDRTRYLRVVAIAVLLIAAIQIGFCALDCDCFLPPSAQMSAHGLASSDFDGCLCCARDASIARQVQVPSPLPVPFAVPPLPSERTRSFALLIDLPPRS